MPDGIVDVMGLDFGLSGGMVWNRADSIHSAPMPLVNETLSIIELREILLEANPSVIFAENIFPRPGQSSVATGTLFRHIGQVEGVASCLNLKLILITPQSWINYFDAGKRNSFATQNLWKHHLLDLAQKIVPGLFLTLRTSDAALIWKFAKENHGTFLRKILPPKYATRRIRKK